MAKTYFDSIVNYDYLAKMVKKAGKKQPLYIKLVDANIYICGGSWLVSCGYNAMMQTKLYPALIEKFMKMPENGEALKFENGHIEPTTISLEKLNNGERQPIYNTRLLENGDVLGKNYLVNIFSGNGKYIYVDNQLATLFNSEYSDLDYSLATVNPKAPEKSPIVYEYETTFGVQECILLCPVYFNANGTNEYLK